MEYYIKKICQDLRELSKKIIIESAKCDERTTIKYVSSFLKEWQSPWVLVHLNITCRLYLSSFFGKPDWEKPDLYLRKRNESCPTGYSLNENLSISIPFEDEVDGIIEREALIFLRSFDGYPKGKQTYLELSQRFLQASNVHLMKARNAYCKLNIHGDIQDYIHLISDPIQELELILIHRDILDPYLQATDTFLYRTFDFRFGVFGDESKLTMQILEHSPKGKFHYAKQTNFSFKNQNEMFILYRGAEILKSDLSKEEAINKIFPVEEVVYESFWVKEFYSQQIIYTSCDPTSCGCTYYRSEKPCELSQVFFRPEVLSKYKQNPDKYSLNEGTIECRGGWFLRSYYFNPAGEIYSYLYDLAVLPHQEQLHWKAHNIKAPVGISLSSANSRDLFVQWVSINTPKEELEVILNNFPQVELTNETLSIWEPKNKNLFLAFNEVQPVSQDSFKELRDFNAALARLTTEGLIEGNLKKWALSLGYTEENLKRHGSGNKIGSIKLLHLCLLKLTNELEANKIHQILSKLHKDKSSQTSHGEGTRPLGRLAKEGKIIFIEVAQAFSKLKILIEDSSKKLEVTPEENLSLG